MLEIESLLDRHVHGLSGGESQRVALGRALSFRPRILLMDEPLNALDEATRDRLCELLRSIQKDSGLTTLHITHSRAEAIALAERLFLLAGGRVSERPVTDLLPSTIKDQESPTSAVDHSDLAARGMES